MDYRQMFENIKKMIDDDPENVRILEEVIDVDLQAKYFKAARKVKKNLNADEALERRDELFDENASIELKKLLLSQLASVNKVEAFRAIELYSQKPDAGLREWSILALQESRMLIHSLLLDKSPIFISTGLGGKGSKLRYFVVFVTEKGEPFEEFQKALINSELGFMMKNHDSEVEEVQFYSNYCTISILIPLRESVKDAISSVVNNCNELGGFLKSEFMVTNVKRMSSSEIEAAIVKEFDRLKENETTNENENDGLE